YIREWGIKKVTGTAILKLIDWKKGRKITISYKGGGSVERLNNQSAVYKKMLQNSNIPREDLSQMAKNNDYQAILYGVPFYLVDEYARDSKKFKYNDPRRLTGALGADESDRRGTEVTFLHNITDSTQSDQGKT